MIVGCSSSALVFRIRPLTYIRLLFYPSQTKPTANSVSLDAKHANNKAAKKANHDRPRKSRPSDINRKPTNYPTWENPPEYTISDN